MTERGNKKQPVRISVGRYHDDKRYSFNAFVVRDDALNGSPTAIEIFGNAKCNIDLISLAGDLVEFEIATSKNASVKSSGIGRINHEGWFSASERPDVALQHIATIDVAKFQTVRTRKNYFDKAFLSYDYFSDISSWPNSDFYGLSYDGTVKKHRFRNGLNRLYSGKHFSATADYHYFFADKPGDLTRRRVCSITVEPKCDVADLKRATDAVRIALAFIYEVQLKPLRKVEVSGFQHREIDFPTESGIVTVNRDRMARPISITNQKTFTSKFIRWMYFSKVDLKHLEFAISRYVAASQELPLELAFSAGCEALESLFTVAHRRATSNPAEVQVMADIRRLIKGSSLSSMSKALAHGRVGNLFQQPLWRQIREYILSRTSLSDEERQIINWSNFYKYRNLSSHGRLIDADAEVSRQNMLMRLTFQLLIKAVSGAKGRLSLLDFIDLQPSDLSEPHFVEIWE